MDLEERYRQWLEQAKKIDAEGLLGDEVKSLSPRLKKGVPTLTSGEVRRGCGFPVRAGVAARIDESMSKAGFKRPPEGKNVNALPTGRSAWQKPRARMPAPKEGPKGGRWGPRGDKRALAPRNADYVTPTDRVKTRQAKRRAWEAKRDLAGEPA